MCPLSSCLFLLPNVILSRVHNIFFLQSHFQTFWDAQKLNPPETFGVNAYYPT